MRAKDKVRMAVDHPNYMLELLHDFIVKDHEGQMKVGGIGDDWGRQHVMFNMPGLKEGDKAWGGHFQIQQMPGCCALMTLSYVYPDPFTQENFQKIADMVADRAREGAFAAILMTQVVPKDRKLDGEPWRLCLKTGWKLQEPLVNGKSGNLVSILQRNLKQPGKLRGFEKEVEVGA